MRYADGGGLTAAKQARLERVYLAAVEMFVEPPAMSPARDVQVARRLRVSQMSVTRWRPAFDADGVQVLASEGAPGGKLIDAQIEQLGRRWWPVRLRMASVRTGAGRRRRSPR